MSLRLVEEVGREHPELWPTNIGRTSYQSTVFVIEKLRAAGRDASLMCKSPGEGQYTPPGFAPRVVIGLDGKPYPCSGVSHDALWCDGEQYDVLGGANEYDRFIYRKSTDPFWSFDPNDGPKIVASPAWSQIARHHWRPNNPPLQEGVVVPGPVPPPPAVLRFPSYADLGDDAFFRSHIGVPLAFDAQLAGEGLNDGSSVWFSRATFLLMTATLKHRLGLGPEPDPLAIVRGVRQEWRAIMRQNHPGLEFPPL